MKTITITVIVFLGFTALLLSIKAACRHPKNEKALTRVDEAIENLEFRISNGIPAFIKELERQAADIRKEMTEQSSYALNDSLHNEMEEIARLLIAVESYKQQCESTMSNLRSAKRRIKRTLASSKHLGVEAEAFYKEIANIEKEAAAHLEVELGTKLGSGAIEDTLIQSKLEELMK